MGKLTERQRKNIVASYAAGGVTMKDLACKYGVDAATISRIIKRDAEFANKCNGIKNEIENETAETMRDYFRIRRSQAQSLLDILLDIPVELVKASSLRDRVGAAHYIKEMFAEGKDEDTGGSDDNVLEVVIVNNAKKGSEGEDK